MRRPTYRDQARLEVTMTPMIDVIFLLMVYFVVTVGFHEPEEVLPTNLRLPGALGAAEPIAPDLADLDEIVVKLFSVEGGVRWRINDKDYDRFEQVDAVLTEVARLKKNLPVILDVAAPVPLGHVIDVYDLCRQRGLAKVQFAAPPYGSPASAE